MIKKPNIILFFTDQQRWDTIGTYGQKLNITPILDNLATDGVVFEEAYTAQPVCGPCRAIFQTGRYPTEINCFRNNQSLPLNIKTLADYMYEAEYECAYVGKWHLASEGDLENTPTIDYQKTPIPLDRRGGYKGYWRAADVLEFTSHGYGGYVYDENMTQIDFNGYRVDCITDFAIDYLDTYQKEKPFFLTISHIEPHHQNDRNCYEGPIGSKNRFRDFVLPGDLAALGGNAKEMYPDYLGCCKSLDDNLGKLINKLREMDLYEDTVFIYVSDHGSHFKTRNRDIHLNGFDDYKRSCHSACLHVPLIISGPGFRGGKRIKNLVSTASLPKTILAIAGVNVGHKMIGENLGLIDEGEIGNRKNYVFAQISESRVGRCIHTEKYLYAVYAPGINGGETGSSDIYEDDFLYDLEKDPNELINLVLSPQYTMIKRRLREILVEAMEDAGEKRPVIVDTCLIR